MPLRIVQITAQDDVFSEIKEIVDTHDVIDTWHTSKNKDGRRVTNVLLHLDAQQDLMDILQTKLSKSKNWRLVVLPVEASIPKTEEPKEEKSKVVKGTITREELYNTIEKGARLDQNFLLLVVFSAIVAAIGLLQNNIAVVIGAMVIAPLLGPNLALAFGAALGDKDLIFNAIKTNLTGLSLTISISALAGLFMGGSLFGKELLDRTEVGFESLILALVSGAAGVLSLTTGLSGALVGVMVAVALMPPAVALGLFLGGQEWSHAYGAGLLLCANIVCVSLSAQIVFLMRGIKPRTYYKKKKSEQSIKYNLLFWGALLLIITALIAMRLYL